MEKELLTKGRIKADLQRNIFMYILSCIASTFGYVFLYFFIVYFFDSIINRNFIVWLITAVFCCALLIPYLVRNITIITLSTRQIKNNKFVITSDSVTKKIKRSYPPSRFPYPFAFIFKQSGKYTIHDFIHYKWSKLYAMKDSEVYESTALNDEFYVLVIKKEVALAYNKRYFELDE